MKLIFLIQAHHDLVQLNRLISKLIHPATKIYVHLDKKSSINPQEINPKAILVQKRVDVRWGAFSQVEATLNGLNQIQKTEADYSHVILLSGEDYPLIPMESLIEKLDAQKNYLSFTEVSESGWDCRSRFQFFHYHKKNPPTKVFYQILNRFIQFTGKKRQMPFSFKAFGGSSWWMLNQKSVAFILNEIRQKPKLIHFFSLCSCSDELFFQTIILNSPLLPTVINNNYRYINWSDAEKGRSNSPNNLNETDFELIAGSGNWFCRKVNSKHSQLLLEKIDRLLLKPNPHENQIN